MATHRPLVVMADEMVLDETLRLAAVAGCETEHVPDLTAARNGWARAPLVLVDEHAADINNSLPRRSGVILLRKGLPEPETWQRAFAIGAEQVISLPEEETDLITAFAEAVTDPRAEAGCVIGVVGGRGGAGASVLSVGVALQAASSGPTQLLDCDPLGGGIDLLLDTERHTGLRWPTTGSTSLDSNSVGTNVTGPNLAAAKLMGMRAAVNQATSSLTVVSCDRMGSAPSEQAAISAIEMGRRHCTAVICDLPRHFSSLAAAVIERVDLLVLVIPAEVRACIAAKCVLDRLAGLTDQVQLVVRGPAPDGIRAEHLAESLGVPLLASMSAERGLGRALERGELPWKPRGPLGMAATTILDTARRNLRSGLK